MKRLTRIMVAVVTTTPLLLAGGVAVGPTAQAATAYPPGGPDQTPVMGWSGWSFLRLGATEADVEGEAKALVSTGLAATTTSTSTTAGTSARVRRAPTSTPTAGGW
jgi:alpha-galactosidase